MPTYVYRFLDADGTIEVQQSFSDPPLTEAVHPADGLLHPVKKVFTPVGITFKGNGFYKTDSRSSSSASKPSTSDSSSGSSSSDTSASTSSASASGTAASSSTSTSTAPSTSSPAS